MIEIEGTQNFLTQRFDRVEGRKIYTQTLAAMSSLADARRRICRMLGIGEADSPIGKKFNEVFHMGTSLEDIKDIREFIYTYILPEPEVNIDFLQKDMRELERLQEILQEAQDREVLLAEINERIIEAKARLSKVKVNEILVAYANYQGNVEEQQEKKRLISEWTASIDILTDKLVELSEKERKASDLLYEARRAAEDNTENKEMLSLEQENKENEKEYEVLKKQMTSDLKKTYGYSDAEAASKATLTAYCFLLFVLLYFPCIATIAAIKGETGSWKWAGFAAGYTTLLAWVVSALVFQIGSLFI